MSWSVNVRMVRREEDGLYHVVLDEYMDELKCLHSFRAQSGFDSELCIWRSAQELKMPDEARVLFEVHHSEKTSGVPGYDEVWNYYTREDCETIVSKTEQEYQKWFHRMAKIKDYIETPEYMALTSKQKKSVKEELIEAEEIFGGEGTGASERFRAACYLYGLWLKYYDYDGMETWLGVRTE